MERGKLTGKNIAYTDLPDRPRRRRLINNGPPNRDRRGVFETWRLLISRPLRSFNPTRFARARARADINSHARSNYAAINDSGAR